MLILSFETFLGILLLFTAKFAKPSYNEEKLKIYNLKKKNTDFLLLQKVTRVIW